MATRVTRKDLEKEVERLNETYCKKGNNQFAITSAYGGHKVVLTGKKGNKKSKLGSAVVEIGQTYHDTPRNTLNNLRKTENEGALKSILKRYK